MKHIRVPLLVVALAMLASACSLFGGDDDGTDLTTDATFTPEPTANIVQAVPADDEGTGATDATDGATTDEAGAPLPTAVTIPTTPEPAEPELDRSQPTTYVVQSGDVLGLIAERFDVDIAELRRVNNLSGNLIRVGQELTIPALDGSTGDVAEPEDEADDETASGPIGSTESPDPAPAPEPVSCGANAVGHCVQSGDSLLGLASQYGVSVDDIRAANPSIVGDLIKVGDLVTIPGVTGGGSGSTDGGSTDGGSTASGSTDPTPTADVPRSDEDCAARNPLFPYFHAADGLCYANPIGADPTTTAATGTGSATDGAVFQELALPTGQTCPDSAPLYGQFVRDSAIVDGPACYPTLAAVAPTSTPGPTSTVGLVSEDFGDGPDCDPWEVVIISTNKCWPLETATDAQREAGKVTPTPTP